MALRFPISLALLVVSCFVAVSSAQEKSMTFDGEGSLVGMEITGKVSIAATKNRAGEGGGALEVGPGGRVVWKLRDRNGSGKVELWVYEDGTAPADPKKRGAGPMWGLVQENGPVLVVGVLYAPYLSGGKTYATSDFDPSRQERPWWNVQYLGLKRSRGWHKWTFAFDPEKGLSLLYDGKDVNARRQVFNWNKTRLPGFNGLLILGDATDAQQTVWVDDVKVTLGPPVSAKPLWPPPPPSGLAPVPPQKQQTAMPHAAWANGPGKAPHYFPIAVWLQDPKNAGRYKAAGFNLYVGLWKGPTEGQLAALAKAGMPVVCAQNEVGLKHLGDKTIVGWMHGDEPDNAQSLGKGKGYGPPIPPQKIIEDYKRIAAADPSRPVLLNLGQGVAWDKWHGRGVRTNHPEDYPEYAKGCDIVSFDIYPSTHRHDEVRGNLWYVANGVARLRQWTRDEKVVWNCIECTRISNPSVKPTPHQVRAEVWMSIIHGSRGLIYFVHQFKPRFIEAGLLADPEMLAAVTALNKQIHSLAAVINSPTITGTAAVKSSAANVPVHLMAKRHGGATYLFAVSLYHHETTATFTVAGLAGKASAEVLGEGRRIELTNGQFADRFKGYDVHLYRIR